MVTVTQTIACDTTAKTPVITSTLSVKPTYAADDGDGSKQSISVVKLDSAMSDTDVDFTFTDDGRLKGINMSQTGQASTIIKDVVTVAASVSALLVEAHPNAGVDNWCTLDAASKPVTITYTAGPLLFAALVGAPAGNITLVPDKASQGLFAQVNPTFQSDSLTPVLMVHPAQPIQTVSDASTSGVPVVLPEMYKVTFDLLWGSVEKKNQTRVDTQDIFIPSESTDPKVPRTFNLYIPSPQPFGTQKFVLGVAESGAVNEIHYVKTTGAASALEAGQSVLTPLQPQSTAEKANAIKAQSDLVYEQQRHAACLAKPSVDNCK